MNNSKSNSPSTTSRPNQNNMLKRSYIPSFQFNPKKYVSKYLKEQDIIQLKQVFDALDEEQTGILAPNQIQYILVQNGFTSNRDTIYDLVGEFSENEVGGLEFQDFVNLMNRRPKFDEDKKEIEKIFKKYDRKNKGYIDFKDFKYIMNQLQVNMPENEIHEIIYQCSQGKGIINLSQFTKIMMADVYDQEYAATVEEKKKKQEIEDSWINLGKSQSMISKQKP